jgi:hypothetical protein
VPTTRAPRSTCTNSEPTAPLPGAREDAEQRLQTGKVRHASGPVAARWGAARPVSGYDAQVLARLGLAVTMGLLLDLLATGDTAGATRAFALFTQLLDLQSGRDISYE